MLVNEELLIVLKWDINFDRNQKATEIYCMATSAAHGRTTGTVPSHTSHNIQRLHITLDYTNAYIGILLQPCMV